jgi:DNA repair protein RadC
VVPSEDYSHWPHVSAGFFVKGERPRTHSSKKKIMKTYTNSGAPEPDRTACLQEGGIPMIEKTPSLPGFENIVKPFKFPSEAYEYKVQALRECPLPERMAVCDTPDTAAEYWKRHVASHPYFNPECECFVAVMLNTRRRAKGHYLVSIGTIDCILVHPRETFRLAIMAAASALVLMHNHPSGESTPSDADIKVTRDLIRAGQLLKIEIIDHVIIGNGNRSSLRELGYFF